MEVKYLIPHYFKSIGWYLFFPSLGLGIWQLISSAEPAFLDFVVPHMFYEDFGFFSAGDGKFYLVKMEENNLANEIVGLMLLLSCLLLVFSKEKVEDEYIMKLRLESMLWASFVNAMIVVFCLLFTYDFTFYYVMLFNLFLLFILYIIRFNWRLHRSRKEGYEE